MSPACQRRTNRPTDRRGETSGSGPPRLGETAVADLGEALAVIESKMRAELMRADWNLSGAGGAQRCQQGLRSLLQEQVPVLIADVDEGDVGDPACQYLPHVLHDGIKVGSARNAVGHVLRVHEAGGGREVRRRVQVGVDRETSAEIGTARVRAMAKWSLHTSKSMPTSSAEMA
jgi:hypothetical protein